MLFEFPTHNIVGISLELERLMKTALTCANKTEPYEHRLCIDSLLAILRILEKPDIKGKLLSELTKFNHTFLRLIETKKVDNLKTAEYTQQLTHHIAYLNQSSSRFALKLQQHPLFKLLSQNHNTPGVNCCLSSPELSTWLNLPFKSRFENLLYWLEELAPLTNIIDSYLSLIRMSGHFETVSAIKSFFQCSLSPKFNCHLIRIKLDNIHNAFPKVNIGQHGLSMQLFILNKYAESEKSHKDLKLEIAFCRF
jgi:cell division protein ZapD